MTRLVAICLGAALWGGSNAGRAQKPDPGTYSAPRYEVKSERGYLVSMRDGVRLSVDLFHPDAPGRFPAILAHTPYDNTLPGLVERARWFASRGYLVALADARGRYDSEGEWEPFMAKHGTDGYDLVEWVAAQPQCSGNVGMMGGSYLGWTQWWAAAEAPPHLKAIAPEVPPPVDLFKNAPYQDGILVSWMIDWSARMAGRTAQRVGPGPYEGHTALRQQNMMHAPHVDLNRLMGALRAPWFNEWVRNNTSNDYWEGRSSKGKYSKITVPALIVTGWFDANFPGSPMSYMGMKEHGATPESRRPKMVVGPWPHAINSGRILAGIDYGPDSLIDLNGYVCRWFDYWLKGIKNGEDQDPPLTTFVMGVNKWHTAQDWPLPETLWTKYYLDSGGRANSLKGDGTLSVRLPAGKPFDTYQYDPRDPTPCPFTGGHVDGPVDTRIPAIRDDVLVYTTPALREPVEVTGPVTARLFAATSARDTDWMVRLIDVGPDGYAALLCDGVIRARYRDPERHGAFTSARLSKIEPNQVYEYAIDFWRATGNVFLPGHRIRVEISSSYYPYYLPNFNAGSDNNGLEIKKVTAVQKIYHSAEYPSHVVLPVIPARR